MDADVVIASVKSTQTRNGNTRWAVTDADGAEYTTFRAAIGEAAERVEGSPAHISFHEEERNGYRNVYLDRVDPLPAQAAPGDGGDDSDPEEAAWRTAVDAAPYLLGEDAADGEVTPEEAFERLKPFKDLVSGDIRSGAKSQSSRRRK